MWWRKLSEVEIEYTAHNLASLPSFYQKLPKLVEIWQSSDKNNFAQFFETQCTSGGREFHVTAAATGNDRRPTVDSLKDGTYSWYDADERSTCSSAIAERPREFGDFKGVSHFVEDTHYNLPSVSRHCLHILTAKRSKYWTFRTIHLLILDQYASPWGNKHATRFLWEGRLRLFYASLLGRLTTHYLAKFGWVPFTYLRLRSLAMKQNAEFTEGG